MSTSKRLREPTRTRAKGTRVTRPSSPKERIDAVRQIVTESQYAKIDGVMVDLFSASAIVSVYDALNETNRGRYASLPVGAMASMDKPSAGTVLRQIGSECAHDAWVDCGSALPHDDADGRCMLPVEPVEPGDWDYARETLGRDLTADEEEIVSEKYMDTMYGLIASALIDAGEVTGPLTESDVYHVAEEYLAATREEE